MSFQDLVALTSKADKLFGLDKRDNSIRPQKSGWLWRKASHHRPNILSPLSLGSKSWFAVKDSFLLWWDSEIKSDLEFDFKPKGVLPLSGAKVELLSPDTVQISSSLLCKSTGDRHLVLRAQDHFEAMEWLDAIKAGMLATFENAAVGFALTEKLKNRGGELEREKDEALERAQNEATRLQKERLEALEIAHMKEEQARLHREEAEQVVENSMDMLEKHLMANTLLQHEREDLMQERRLREKLEEEAMEAQEALAEIEAAFEAFEVLRLERLLKQEELANQSSSPTPPPCQEETEAIKPQEDVRKNVKALRDYFEALSMMSNQQRLKETTASGPKKTF